MVAVFVVGAAALVALLWCLSASLWRAAQADAAQAESDLRLQGLAPRETAPALSAGGHAHAERVQAAIYAISEAASSAASLGDLFAAIHAAVGELMPARNFYIALHEPATDLLSFPYFVDEVDRAPEPRPLGTGITEYVLRTGEPLLASPSVAADLERTGGIELIGAPSIDWLGVPLKVADTTFGVLVVQSYTEGVRYSDEDKTILIFVSRQVAMAIARTQAQEALRASEATNRAILEAIPDIVFRFGSDGVFLDYKASRISDLAMPPERFLGKRIDEVLPPEVARLSMDKLAAALLDRRVHVYEYDLELGGELRSWESRMVASGTVEVVAIVREITERRRAEQALRESEERYRRLVEMSPDGIAIHRDGRVVFCNLTGARMLGFDVAEEVIGRPILDFVQAGFRDVVARRVRDALALGEPQPPIEEKFVKANGTPIDVEVTSTPFFLAGRPAVLVVFRDITPRLQLEEHVRHMQKMDAIGRLAGGVAHDFNNLLQALLSTVDVLQMHAIDPERLAATVLEMETNIKRGAALTRQLLLFARRELARPERVDLNEVVTKAAALLRRLVRANIRLTLLQDGSDLPLDADRGQLEQVLVNLVVNAADAMPDAGELTIRTGGAAVGEVWVEVTDTGVGIPPELQTRIFEPFFTTKAPERGTGMGLAVVHGIVTQHGGRIEVASAVGKGSTFRAVLPRAGTASVEGPRAPSGPANVVAAARGERVLIVEDEEGARRALAEILGLLGFTVAAAASGEEGEELAARGRFDVLLTDFVLPGIDGGELARRLVASTPALRVIVMSGYAEDESMRLGVLAGTVRFLQKPFDVETLSRAMNDALAGGGPSS